MNWKKIIEEGFPKENEPVFITFGDKTIFEIAKWYKDELGVIKWQAAGLNSNILPVFAEYWKPIYVIKDLTIRHEFPEIGHNENNSAVTSTKTMFKKTQNIKDELPIIKYEATKLRS